ncbi:MAG: DUF927 domain-containing protein [Tissierellaceae bacterium]|nr:DUF927 domain-containing protein [Tissierellaceae bacterium]
MDQGETQQIQYRYSKVMREGDVLYSYDSKSEEYFYMCRYVSITQVRTNIITGDVDVEIEYVQNGEIRTMVLPRENLVKSKLLNVLPAKGLDVTDLNINNVLEYLLYTEEFAEHVYVHNQVGWAEVEGVEVYLHQDVIGLDYESDYVGQLNIAPKGSLEQHVAIIEEHVLGFYPLELAYVLGLSSPVASKLRKLLGIDVLFFHIYGNSTTGKTTAMMLATSSFGHPDKKNQGLIKTWLATNNAIIGQLQDIHGVPMVMDEASTKVKSDYSNLIYQIVDGMEKGRLNKNGDAREKREWSGTILSTGENSLLANSNQNNGLRVRVIELGEITWTKSAQHSEVLKAELLNHYGHSGVKFVEYLLQLDDEAIIEGFKLSKEAVKSKIEVTDNFTDRISDKMAVIYLTAKLAKEALDINLNEDEILQILVNADSRQVEDRDLSGKAYEYLKSEITRNLNKFIYKDEVSTYDINKSEYKEKEIPSGEIIGRLEMKNRVITQALIPKEQLSKLLKKGSFTDVDIILSKWRDDGLIDTDEGKFTKKRVLFNKGIPQRVIVINVDSDTDDEDSKRSIIPKNIIKNRSETRIDSNSKSNCNKSVIKSGYVGNLFNDNYDEDDKLGGDNYAEVKN